MRSAKKKRDAGRNIQGHTWCYGGGGGYSVKGLNEAHAVFCSSSLAATPLPKLHTVRTTNSSESFALS